MRRLKADPREEEDFRGKWPERPRFALQPEDVFAKREDLGGTKLIFLRPHGKGARPVAGSY